MSSQSNLFFLSVCLGQHHLAKIVISEHRTCAGAIKLQNYLHALLKLAVDVLAAYEVGQVVLVYLVDPSRINQAECLLRLEVWVHCQVLPPRFDL